MIPENEFDIGITVGRNAKMYFEEKGFSHSNFAYRLIKSANLDYVYDLFEGKVHIKINALQKLAYVLEVSTLDLLKGLEMQE